MNAENTAHPIIRKTVKKLSLYLVSLLYLILLVIAASNFYESDCLLFGPEQIVGALNVGYHDNGSFYYTNPFAMLFRHVLYMLLIAALTWLAATGCESPRLPSTGFMKSMRRLLLACVFTGIFIGIGSGILSSTYRRNTELWQNVSSFHSLAQYKTTSEIRNIIYRKSMRKILNNLCKTAGCAIGNLSWVKRYMFSAPHGRSAVFSSGRRMGRLSKPLGAAVCKTHAVF